VLQQSVKLTKEALHPFAETVAEEVLSFVTVSNFNQIYWDTIVNEGRSKMADAPVHGYQAFWAERSASLKSEYQILIKQYPDADPQYRLLYEAICSIEDLARCKPAAVGDSAEWTPIVNTAEDNRASYCKALSGSVLFSALHGVYTVALKDLKSLLKSSNSAGGTATGIESVKPTQEDGYKDVRRRKRHSTNEAAPTSKKPAAEAKPPPPR
jgi:hypothetical protein